MTGYARQQQREAALAHEAWEAFPSVRLRETAGEVWEVDFLIPLGAPMVSRGEMTEAVYDGMVTLMSARRTVYQHSLRGSLCREASGRRNASIQRPSAGTRIATGDLVLAREIDSSLHRQGVGPKLVHEKWTGPWKVVEGVINGLSVVIDMEGRATCYDFYSPYWRVRFADNDWEKLMASEMERFGV